jgi:hypothetical protein
VSESALTQAVRTIRRTLYDDPREPRFIRTVSRHGYRFVFTDVVEEGDEEEHDGAARPLEVPEVVQARALQRPSEPHGRRWTAAAAGGGLAGMLTGVVGGLILAAAPGSNAPFAIAAVLAVIGGACGAVGGTGVGAGIRSATAAARYPRTFALIAASAIGGGLVGAAVQWLTRWALLGLFGISLPVGGGVEGVMIGGAAGMGFAIATRRTSEGWLTARRGQRLHAALVIALCCGLAGLALTLAGRPLASGTVDAIAKAASGSRATLAPLARLLGEPEFGPVSSATLGFVEGAMFGLGCALGLIERATP